MYGILQIIQQQLTVESKIDGNIAPNVANSWKQKVASDEAETNKKLERDIYYKTNSIKGLVIVAQQSLNTQILEMLYQLHHELESTVEFRWQYYWLWIENSERCVVI